MKKMNSSFYFPHNNNAYSDEKIVDLRMKHGIAGYGVFWAIIELLHQNNGKMDASSKRLAFALQLDEQLIESVLNDFGLFEKETNKHSSKIFSKRMMQDLMKRKQISQIRRKVGRKGGKAKATERAIGRAIGKQLVSKNSQERRGKERKGKEIKGEDIGRENNSTYLKNLNEEEIKELNKKFGIPFDSIKVEREKAMDWLKETGTRKKDYRAFFNNWLRRFKNFNNESKPRRVVRIS